MPFTSIKNCVLRGITCLMAIFLIPTTQAAPAAPTGLVSRSGDQSIVLHWDQTPDTNITGYYVYRSLDAAGPYVRQTTKALPFPSHADFDVTNSAAYFYQVTALSNGEESPMSTPIQVAPKAFANDDEFLEYVQQTSFDYFWYTANPTNGMVPDRSTVASPCSIAAVGFGLTAIGIGIDHGWITREQGRTRVLATLKTFTETPQGTNRSGTIGYNGWFYHFLDMKTATRYTQFSNVEVSSVDTAWLLAGALYAKQFFDGADADETAIRTLADTLYQQANWTWMARNTNVFSMGWLPNSGFISSKWIGYNEAMALVIMGLGAETNAIPDSAWNRWTSGYTWKTYYGQSYIPFAPLFGHQYSHCWIDFRHISDSYLNTKGITYFENSRRATLAQRAYCIANSGAKSGYGTNGWGLTACDGPTGYKARGAPPAQDDDGTIAPTAAGGSMPFTPEYSLPALRSFYDKYRTNIWTGFGFRDAFNLGVKYWDQDTIGIDQGPIVIMIENHRTQKVWQLFMKNPEIQRGLQRAGFLKLAYAPPALEVNPADRSFRLAWEGTNGRGYQVEYSTDLAVWRFALASIITATNTTPEWNGSAGVSAAQAEGLDHQMFFRVLQFGTP